MQPVIQSAKTAMMTSRQSESATWPIARHLIGRFFSSNLNKHLQEVGDRRYGRYSRILHAESDGIRHHDVTPSRRHGNGSDVYFPYVLTMKRTKESHDVSFFDNGIKFVPDIREERLDIVHPCFQMFGHRRRTDHLIHCVW